MKSLTLCLIVTFVELCSSTSQLIELYNINTATPTKVNNVEDGSKLYLASSDKALMLSRITLSSNGQTRNLQQLLNDFDANGYSNGFPVNSDLTVATTNTADDTDKLNGCLFISNADMAKDPNFLVYVVSDEVKTIDRSASNETTLLLLNKKMERTVNDPATKPYFNTRLEGISQQKNTVLRMYREVPGDGYTDPSFQGTISKLIFINPVYLFPTGKLERDSVFFDNIEPIQYSMRSCHIRATGGGVSFKVSPEWRDLSTYQTTNETTTGYTMTQYTSENSTTNFKYTPGHDGMFGYMMTTDVRSSNMNVTSCNEIDCIAEQFLQTAPVVADYFQYDRNDTVMYVDHANRNYGYFYLQYFRIEKDASPPPSSSTTVKLPETTTKSSFSSLSILSVLATWILLL